MPTRPPLLPTALPATRPDSSLQAAFCTCGTSRARGRPTCSALRQSCRWLSQWALLLWGDLDRAVAPASAIELHHRWKNSAVIMMARIGHMPYEEVPAEFNRIVLDFLLRDTPATPLQSDTQPAMAHTSS